MRLFSETQKRLARLLVLGSVIIWGVRAARRERLRLKRLAARRNADRPLRVLLVSARAFPYMGGVETHVYEVSRRMAARGCEVTSLSTDVEGSLPQDEVVDHVHILRRPAYPKDRDYYFSPGIFWAILRGEWDIIHCQGYHTLVPPLAMLAALITQTPYVLSFHSGGHSSSTRNQLRGLQVGLLRPLLARAAMLVAVSQFEARSFAAQLRFSAERFVVIPNGAKLPDSANIVRTPSEFVTILSVGRLERYKGHHRLIEALPQVLAQFPNARLRILGKGTYEADLRNMVKEAGLESFVTITHVPPEDRSGMARELINANLVVLFSEYEAHPVTVMEAAALECSILVADTSGLSEIAEKGLARAIPLDSTNAELAAAIVQQLREPLHPPQVELPSWEECTGELLAVYRRVLDAI